MSDIGIDPFLVSLMWNIFRTGNLVKSENSEWTFFGGLESMVGRLQNISKTGEDSGGLEGTQGKKKQRGNSEVFMQ